MAIPEHLNINGRKPDQNFTDDDNLFHGFELDEYDSIEKTVKVETIRFPDFSCNWSRYSSPRDVVHRRNGKITDGCYSFTVEISRYRSLATPVHDPDDDPEYPNYSHVEIRHLEPTDPPDFIPPKNRPKKKGAESKAARFAYRENIVKQLEFEFMPSA